MGVGENIKLLLKDRNQTIDWLAKQTDLSVHTLYGITKRDTVNVREKTLKPIAECLNVTMDELKYGIKNTSTIAQEPTTEISSTPLNTPTSTKPSKKGVRRVPLRDAIAEIDVKDFKKTISQMEERLEGAKNSTAFHPKILEHIIQRKEDELELLKLFFLLTPSHRKIAIASIERELIRQEKLKLDMNFEDVDVPDEWLDDFDSSQFERTPEEWVEEIDMQIQEKEIEEKITEKLGQLEI